MSGTTDHFSWREVLDAIERRSDDAGLPRHLRDCAECRDDVRAASTLLGAFRFAADPGPSETLLARTWQQLRALGRTTELPPELARAVEQARAEAGPGAPTGSPAEPFRRAVRRTRTRIEATADRVRGAVRAALLVDSWFDPALAVRGSMAASPRILVYETPDYTVSLSLHSAGDPEDPRVDLVGQLTPKKGTSLPEGTRVRLDGTAGDPNPTDTSPFGEFRFDQAVPAGARLTIEVGGQTIEVGPLPEMGVA